MEFNGTHTLHIYTHRNITCIRFDKKETHGKKEVVEGG